MGPAKAARQLDMSAKTLANWLGASRAGQPLSSPSRKPVSEMESELARLRAENATLKMEREILKKSDGVLRQGVQVRYAFVARERARYPLRMLCRLLAVSVSGFHGWLQRRDRPDPEAALRADLRTLHAGSRGTYGRPRMVRALRACAHAVGHKRVARLMREEGLCGKTKGRFTPRTTDSRHGRPVAGNRLDRQFAVNNPVPAWVGDITCLPTRQGWLYLATVIDLRTRQVLGYSLSERLPDTLVQQAFLNAWSVAPVGAGVLFHPDRGAQYASGDFGKTLAAHGFVPSISRKGNGWERAACPRGTTPWPRASSPRSRTKRRPACTKPRRPPTPLSPATSTASTIPPACTRRLATCRPTTTPGK
nr:IS3 family transposase [Xanthomonas theicola]